MYRRQRGGLGSFTFVIVLGIVVGVGYLLYDQLANAPVTDSAPVAAAIPQAEVAANEDAPLVSATPQTAAPLLRKEITAGAHLAVPTAGISTDIIQSYLNGESWDINGLGTRAGHLQGTGWLSGSGGNIVLAGHVEMSDGRRGIFANLTEVSIGDPVILMQDGVEYVYEIISLRTVSPDDMSVIYPTTHNQITLITCSSYDFLQDVYQQRVVVVAQRVTERAAPQVSNPVY